MARFEFALWIGACLVTLHKAKIGSGSLSSSSSSATSSSGSRGGIVLPVTRLQGSEPGECKNGTAVTFDQARAQTSYATTATRDTTRDFTTYGSPSLFTDSFPGTVLMPTCNGCYHSYRPILVTSMSREHSAISP
jgi:hypothetical protein